MHRPNLLYILIILLSLGLFGTAQTAAGAEPPSSPRSRAAINRVRSRLVEELSAKKLRYGSPVFLRLFKESGVLELWVKGAHSFELFKSYPICAFSGSLGPKLKQGDGQAPEGFYFVTPDRMNPHSRFHLSFNLGYPNSYDRAHGRTGSALMIHGNCVSIGCYAMTDAGIEEIYSLVNQAMLSGQAFVRVHIFPFRITAERLERERKSEWYSFWSNLKEGYDLFERIHVPPDTRVSNKQYEFVGP